MNRFTLAFVLAFSLTVSAAQHPDGNYVVTLVGNMSPDTVLRQHGLGASKKWTHAIHGFYAHLNGNQADRLEQDTRVLAVETNLPRAVLTQTIPTGVRRVGCQSNALWAASSVTPINVDVAVLDTGVGPHADLNIYRGVSFTTDNTDGSDYYGHGTHVAGIIGAKNDTSGVVGVAPGCRIWSVRVLYNDGTGSVSDIISGIDYVTQHASEIEVANMSLGGLGYTAAERLAIQNSVAAGVVYVVAAGNSSYDVLGGDGILGTGDDMCPAAFPECMTVAAITDTDGIAGGWGSINAWGADDAVAGYSNYSLVADSSNPVSSPGLAIDVAAPGTQIYSTYVGNTYAYMSGTSMASPHVAGAVALYIAANARATTAAGVYAIRQAIINRATDWNHWGMVPLIDYGSFAFAKAPLIDVSDGAKPTTYPIVTMTSPRPNDAYASNYPTNTTITLTATATDATDGNITSKIKWVITKDSQIHAAWGKLIATGGSATVMLTNLGIQAISAGVSNSVSHYAEVTAKVIGVVGSGAVAPTVSISSPVDGSTVAAADVQTFTASATDPVDGNIAYKLAWNSSVDGFLGNGATFTNFLSAGSHVITAAVTNVAGLSGSHSHSITVTGVAPPPPPVNYPPVVTIDQPANGQSFPAGTVITAVGTATDVEDGDLSANITWSDSIAGGLGRGATAAYTPAAGTHILTVQVADSSGALGTDKHTITITAVGTPLTVTVAANKSAYVNKEKALITTTVKQAGVAVSGASVTVQVRSSTGRNVASKTGTTTSAGTFAFYLPIQKSKYGSGAGPFTATVTANASRSGYVAGVGTTTFSVY